MVLDGGVERQGVVIIWRAANFRQIHLSQCVFVRFQRARVGQNPTITRSNSAALIKTSLLFLLFYCCRLLFWEGWGLWEGRSEDERPLLACFLGRFANRKLLCARAATAKLWHGIESRQRDNYDKQDGEWYSAEWMREYQNEIEFACFEV